MEESLRKIRKSLIIVIALTVILLGLVVALVLSRTGQHASFLIEKNAKRKEKKQDSLTAAIWKSPDVAAINNQQEKELVSYGRELIASTAQYLGPEGTVGKLSNGMNCQNCHLDAGTKPFGNNYSAVFSTYPKFRARSGTKETIVKRISDCFERSLNGTPPDSTGREMKAMVAYISFLGSEVKKGSSPKGSGIVKLAFLSRPADPLKGKLAYQAKCVSCHGSNGEGLPAPDKKTFTYPPLWGPHSYNDAAGLYRLSNFAGYIKNNMPYGASYENQLLSDEESWDLAAFVNSQSRPHKDQQRDWSDISKKPIDFPFGPYTDQFTEVQHKYGPFSPIKKAHL
ncbi:cytochrome C [Pedobacter kyungheensis]|uniref:Cytochrome C n=1 Tax=Pedobacter kyungheensis TaxID=1069985 RepID=A0A0C1FLX2_9SPHI|nr:c-type cytochrome [Pedobacter kyungheensis]KIA88934.1 cytochrome C [Pedobacter kyungheensis]